MIEVIDAGLKPETRASRASARARAGLWWDLTVGLVYLAGAVLVLRGLWAHPRAVDVVTNVWDRPLFEWMLVHATRIFSHGENPFVSPQLNAPLGVNVMANVGLLGLAIPAAPVTLLLGAAVSYVLLTTVGLAGTATAWYVVLSRRLVAHRLAAAVAGGFAGFAPGMINHASGHPHLVVQFLIPLIVWRALALGQPDRPRRVWLRDGVVLGLLITWQVFLSEELLLITALAGVVFVAGYAAFRPSRVLTAVRPFLRGGAVAGLTAGVLLSYPLWYQFAGPQHWHGLSDGYILTFGADLASYPAIAWLSLIGKATAGVGPNPEANSYLGWPLLIVGVLIVVWLWRRVEVRALAIVGLIFVVLSLGVTVRVGGRVIDAPGPWHWLHELPLFDSVLPGRLGLALVPVLAVLLALAIDRLLAQPSRVRLGVGLAVIAVALVPVIPRQVPVQPRLSIPTFITSGHWRQYLVGDRALLSADTTGFGNIEAMAWDNATGQQYRMVGGYFLGPDATGHGTFGPVQRPTAALLAWVGYGYGTPAISGAQRATAQADVRFWDAGLVVLADDAPYAADLRTTLVQLFGPGQRVDDVWLWTLT